jgi:hypothetical protein
MINFSWFALRFRSNARAVLTRNFHLWVVSPTFCYKSTSWEALTNRDNAYIPGPPNSSPSFVYFPVRGQHSKTVRTEMVFLFQKAWHEHIQCTQYLDVGVCFPFDIVNITTPLRRQARRAFRPMVQSTFFTEENRPSNIRLLSFSLQHGKLSTFHDTR